MICLFSQVRLLLKSAAEADEVKEELKTFRETLVLEHLPFEFKDSEGESPSSNRPPPTLGQFVWRQKCLTLSSVAHLNGSVMVRPKTW